MICTLRDTTDLTPDPKGSLVREVSLPTGGEASFVQSQLSCDTCNEDPPILSQVIEDGTFA